MELIDIKDVCFKNLCVDCPLYDEEECECVLEHCPIRWDLEDIKRRLEKYYKKGK